MPFVRGIGPLELILVLVVILVVILVIVMLIFGVCKLLSHVGRMARRFRQSKK